MWRDKSSKDVEDSNQLYVFLHSSESPPFRILCTAKKPATLIGSRHVVMLLIFFEDQGRIMSAESERVAEDNI